MKQKFLYFILIALFFSAIVASILYPDYIDILGISIILLCLALSTYAIFQTHKHTPNARIKIAKDILIFLVTFLLILFIGGVVGMLVNFYVSNLYGAVIGFVCAMLVCFMVGYGVRKGFAKFGL
ncbi:MAG: hypothetical protein LC108_01655 [Anaerolineales bacterium]|nr:hypothetical protein [Anaerolineales bacterium]